MNEEWRMEERFGFCETHKRKPAQAKVSKRRIVNSTECHQKNRSIQLENYTKRKAVTSQLCPQLRQGKQSTLFVHIRERLSLPQNRLQCNS
jgi:hypothetical protein